MFSGEGPKHSTNIYFDFTYFSGATILTSQVQRLPYQSLTRAPFLPPSRPAFGVRACISQSIFLGDHINLLLEAPFYCRALSRGEENSSCRDLHRGEHARQNWCGLTQPHISCNARSLRKKLECLKETTHETQISRKLLSCICTTVNFLERTPTTNDMKY
jgi:hypothetical protein